MPSLSTLGSLAAAAMLLAGCAVYAPTVPSTPLLEARQVEITANVRSATALEAGVAWSPVPHLLLLGEAALQARGTTTTTTTINNTPVTNTYEDYHRQAGLGVGLYRAPTDQSPWYMAATGGVGFAKVNLYSVDVDVLSVYLPLPIPYISGFYDVSYWRYHGQVYAARPLSRLFMGGFSVRGTYVDYTRFTYESQPVEPANHFFLEPTLFLRLGKGAVRGQATAGLSVPLRREASSDLTKRTAPVSSLISVGVIVRPDLIRWLHRK